MADEPCVIKIWSDSDSHVPTCTLDSNGVPYVQIIQHLGNLQRFLAQKIIREVWDSADGQRELFDKLLEARCKLEQIDLNKFIQE